MENFEEKKSHLESKHGCATHHWSLVVVWTGAGVAAKLCGLCVKGEGGSVPAKNEDQESLTL